MAESITLTDEEAAIAARAVATAVVVLRQHPPRWPNLDQRQAVQRLLVRLAGDDAHQQVPHLSFYRR